MASDNRNHEARKRRMSGSCGVRRIVRYSCAQEWEIYDQPLADIWEGNGGPGRGRSHRAEGMVKTNHHRPIRKRTSRSENDEEDMRRRMPIDIVWRRRAAV